MLSGGLQYQTEASIQNEKGDNCVRILTHIQEVAKGREGCRSGRRFWMPCLCWKRGVKEVEEYLYRVC